MMITSCGVEGLGSGDAGLFHSQATSRDSIAMLVPGTSGKGPDIDVAVARSCCSLARPPCGLAALAFTDNLPGRIRHRFIFMIRAN